ncbi:MAG: TetR/AcrR family transcriptional regulator [Sandaracinaceae bacterium]
MPKNESPFTASDAPRKKGRADKEPPDKRERILRAAIKVFARKGFYATRVSEIAKAAGVADGTIYLYFKNKDDVLVSIFSDRLTRLLTVLRREIDAAPDFDAKLRRAIELQLGLLEGQRDLAEVVTVNLRQSSLLLKQYAAPLFTEYLDVLASVIAMGQREGIVAPELAPRVVATALWGALDGVALTWAIGSQMKDDKAREDGRSKVSSDERLRRAATQIARIFLHGVRAERA